MKQRELFPREREYTVCFVTYPNGRTKRGKMFKVSVRAHSLAEARRKAREIRRAERS